MGDTRESREYLTERLRERLAELTALLAVRFPEVPETPEEAE